MQPKTTVVMLQQQLSNFSMSCVHHAGMQYNGHTSPIKNTKANEGNNQNTRNEKPKNQNNIKKS